MDYNNSYNVGEITHSIARLNTFQKLPICPYIAMSDISSEIGEMVVDNCKQFHIDDMVELYKLIQTSDVDRVQLIYKEK